MIRKSVLVLLVVLLGLTTPAHTQDQHTTNKYVDYINESIHGILIVHRLLQNYNKEVNKYVDLESTQLNFYSNRDLALDVFDSKSFYSPTPEQLYTEARRMPNAPRDVGKYAEEIRNICKQLNQLRFDIEKSINDYDLTKPENLGRVYTLLQKGEILYQTYYDNYRKIDKVATSYSTQKGGIESKLFAIYTSMKHILTSLRGERIATDLQPHMELIQSAIVDIKRHKIQSKATDNIILSASKFIDIIRQYSSSEPLPKEYKNYGRNYYYYNTEAITKFNWYGQGVVREINSLLEGFEGDKHVRLLELPHYFKVIYPKRKEKIGRLPVVKKNNTLEKKISIKSKAISVLPEKVKGRNVRLSRKTLKSSELDLDIEIYDHMIVDGDIVSVSFNGVWIVEKELLEKKPIKRSIRINPESKNYLLLHAENLGSRPPNTAAIRYKYFGSYRQVILNSDLDNSELIEIEYVR